MRSARLMPPSIAVFCMLSLAAINIIAGYKARPWTIRPQESYPCRLTSEGITIAVEPLFKDARAAQIFDKSDMVTRGIMPLAVVIFNTNDFPVTIEGATIELTTGEEHVHTILPQEAVHRLFQKGSGSIWIPSIPRLPSGEKLDSRALADFEQKFLARKVVPAHEKGGGFLYMHIPGSSVSDYLVKARLYVPDVYRQDTGQKMIFFEIDTKAAVTGPDNR